MAVPGQTRRLSRFGTVVWALMPVLSFGVLTPVPFVHAAVKLRRWRTWAATAAYAIAYLTLLLLIGASESSGGLRDSLYGALWWALIFAATVHAFLLRGRVFAVSPTPVQAAQPTAAPAPAARRGEQARVIVKPDTAPARDLRPSPAGPVDETTRLRRAAEMLATAVQDQWQAEAGQRSLRRAAPLRLAWASTVRPVAAPGEFVAGTTVPGWVDEVAERFLALPDRRLVVLGEPGAGKTALALLLTLALLKRWRRRPDQPVPVLLSLSSWDPTKEHLHPWLTRRLGEDYPTLASLTGRSATQQLIASGRLLLILDGLEELPSRLRPTAIGELDCIPAGEPLIVTCRSQEYQQAAPGGALAAAVAELQPLSAAEVTAFLRTADVPTPGWWDQVAAHLDGHPGGVLAAALSTPLMVVLARTVYTSPGCDPSKLVDLAQASDRATVEQHLLDGFLLAAYTTPVPDSPAPGTRPPPADLARRWLTWLATHLSYDRTRDLAWWQLSALLPQSASGRAGRFVMMSGRGLGRLGGLVGGVVGGRTGGHVGLLMGLLAGLIVGLIVGGVLAAEKGEAPSASANLQIPRKRGDLLRDVGRAFGYVGPATGVMGVLTFGLAGKRLAGLLGGLTAWLRRLVDAAPAVTPRSALRDGRTVAGALGLVVGLLGGLVVGLLGGLLAGLMFGVVGGLIGGLLIGFAAMLQTAWGQFTILRGWLAIRRKLPLRLMAFLDDAYDRGVLRQAGPVYQFRHARLQDHLADSDPMYRPLRSPW